jgi:hypothetical protein
MLIEHKKGPWCEYGDMKKLIEGLKEIRDGSGTLETHHDIADRLLTDMGVE